MLGSPAGAQVTIPQEYSKIIAHSGEVTAFGNEGFGDRIDLGTGGLEIVQTDIDLPGNNALPMRVGRRFIPGDKYGGGFFGVWSLDIPYIYGIFGNHPNMPKGWRVAGSGTDQYKRCSQFSAPPDLLFQIDGHYLADEYWHGSFFYLPGGGNQELLNAGSAHVPTDGNTYPIVTKSGAAVRCVALSSTSESGSQGEGFEVVTPDGLIYTMNQMVSRPNAMISKPIDQQPYLQFGDRGRNPGGRPPPPQTVSVNFTLPRIEVRVYPTKVADRFGNYMTYTWSATNPQQLLQMASSDGRRITFTYGPNIVVSDGSRNWTYSIENGTETVTRPDGSAWRFSLRALFEFNTTLTTGDGCSSDVTYNGSSSVTGSITAPSGATAVYTMAPVAMGRSWVPLECVWYNGSPLYAREPKGFVNLAVTGKKMTGPGLPSMGLSWIYAYGPPNGCWTGSSPGCTTSSPVTRTMSVTDPDGVVNRYTFGNRYAVNEGMQLKVDYGWNGTTALRTVDTTYADPNAGPYSQFNGNSPRQRGDVLMNDAHPQRQVTTTQQGRTFTWKVETGCNGYPYCFDTYARPTKVTKSSSP